MTDPFSSDHLSGLKYPTPYFLFSKDRIKERYDEFKKYFPGAHIHYAMKANAETGLLKTLLDLGSSFEVASMHELEMLKAIQVPPERIIYGTSVKPAEHIRAFRKYGVDRFAADSSPELEKIAANAPGAKVYIRMLVDDTGSVY